MDSAAATHLAELLEQKQQTLCHNVAARMLRAYPELGKMLRLEEQYGAVPRFSSMAVERLGGLVRAVLLFELPSLADNELMWAHSMLLRSGVTSQHHSSLVRWFFEELRRLPLSPAEGELTIEIERYFLSVLRRAQQGVAPEQATHQ
jgi:hypothetical protein